MSDSDNWDEVSTSKKDDYKSELEIYVNKNSNQENKQNKSPTKDETDITYEEIAQSQEYTFFKNKAVSKYCLKSIDPNDHLIDGLYELCLMQIPFDVHERELMPILYKCGKFLEFKILTMRNDCMVFVSFTKEENAWQAFYKVRFTKKNIFQFLNLYFMSFIFFKDA
jgi:hypothetical protein